MPDENPRQEFPFKTVLNYLDDIELREKIINANLKFISISRESLQMICLCTEIAVAEEAAAGNDRHPAQVIDEETGETEKNMQ